MYFSEDDFQALIDLLDELANPDYTSEAFANMFTTGTDGNYVLTADYDTEYVPWIQGLFGSEYDPDTNPFLVFTGVDAGTSTQGGGVL